MEESKYSFGPDRGEPAVGCRMIAGDRRLDRRYDLRLTVRWKLVRGKRILETGKGTTLDLSSSGVLFETDRQLPSGGNIELSICWPVLLHNVAPLQLVISGRVVRVAGSRTAIRMTQHEFRTSRPNPERDSAMGSGQLLSP